MAALGYRLGMFRGRGRPSPPPHTLFTPLREVGVGSNGGLCLQLEEVAQKDVREARGSQRREAPRPRQGADEGRRRLARGPEHIRPGLQGARPLRTLVGAGVGGQLERECESVEGQMKAAVRVRGTGAEARWRRRASEACAAGLQMGSLDGPGFCSFMTLYFML